MTLVSRSYLDIMNDIHCNNAYVYMIMMIVIRAVFS